MRKTRKINRGFVLFLILLAAVAVYLVALDISRESQKAEIKEICMEATDRFSQCIVIPPELYVTAETYSESAFDQYINECYSKLAPLCSETNTARSMVRYALESQANKGIYITKFGKAAIQNMNYSFNGDTISVSISANLNYKNLYPDLTGVKESGTLMAYPYFSFKLKKEAGKWKLVAFDPDLSAYNDYYYGGFY